jgi:hypothetical protein
VGDEWESLHKQKFHLVDREGDIDHGVAGSRFLGV